jgi:hypothetical protein
MAAQAAELDRLRQETTEIAAHDAEQALPMDEDRDGEVTAEDLDRLLDEMLESDAEQRAAGAQEEEEQVAQERAIALAPLPNDAENVPLPPETDAPLAEPSRPVTQFDLAGLIAKWRERGSQLNSDHAQSSRNTRQRNAQGQQQSKPAGIRKSQMRDRWTRQVANRTSGRAAAIYDQLGWDFKDPGSASISQTRVP